MTKTRRDFVRGAAAAGLAAAWPFPVVRRSADATFQVMLDEPIGTIAPELHGHFVEHLGGVVYDGIWVGRGSRIPNVNGVRRSLIDALKRIRPPVIRWPGGCFADQYDWRDGTGPRADRPTRTNFWVDASEWPKAARKDGPQRYEPNQFGTADFARFCGEVGAAPYLAVNLRSLPAQEFWRWIEYTNSPAGSTTLARRRAADGAPAPFGVRFWGVGNESWGCGGNFAPEVSARAGVLGTARAAVLNAGDVHAHNSFAEPNAVGPRPLVVAARPGGLIVVLPPASVVRVECGLG